MNGLERKEETECTMAEPEMTENKNCKPNQSRTDSVIPKSCLLVAKRASNMLVYLSGTDLLRQLHELPH